MKFITLDADSKVIATRDGAEIVEGEIQSDIGELGQIRQEDGSFIDDPVEETAPTPPTNSQIAQMISDLNGALKLAGLI